MVTIPVKSVCFIDPLPVAECIDAMFSQYLISPPLGFYKKKEETPFIVPNCLYFTLGPDQLFHQKVILFMDPPTEDLYNEKGVLIFSKDEIADITLGPKLPVVALNIVNAFVDAVINENSAWCREPVLTNEKIWEKFIQPEYRNQGLEERIYSQTIEMQREIQEFIGKDNWVMHFKRRRNNDILIEKTIDYRVYSWECLFGNEFRNNPHFEPGNLLQSAQRD